MTETTASDTANKTARGATPDAIPEATRGPEHPSAPSRWLAREPVPVLIALLWLAATLGTRALMLPDEGRYVGVAWEMLRSGDWLTPTLEGLPFFHKPPLFYWLSATGLWLGGEEGWARLPSLVGALLAASSVYLLALRSAGPTLARTTLLVFVTQPLVFMAAQFANLDMLVAGCISATIALAARAALDPAPRPPRTLLAAAYAMAAMGVLAKGLIGFLLPGLVIVVWLVLLGRWRRLLALLWWPGIVLFLVLAAPWFVVMHARHPQFLHYFFVVQHFERFSQGGFNNVQPRWFYPAVLLLLGLPWTPWLLAGLWRALRAARVPAAALGGLREQPLRLLAIVWCVAITGFFSLPASKLVGYVLPAVPPLALLIADVITQGRAAGSLSRWRIGLGAIAVLMCLAALVGIARHRQASMQVIGPALRAQMQPDDPVIKLGTPAYDLGFYARLPAPAWVIEDWDDPALTQRDNWRKELADAAPFASPGAAAHLMRPSALVPLLCASRARQAWFIGDAGWGAGAPPVVGATIVLRDAAQSVLWRVPLDAFRLASCAGTPSAN
jgi:4-amino-4-deoxy-L-arabinose transferase-like glycosyltransferase